MEGKKWFAYGTRHTLAVTHPVTNRARRCLTSAIGREWLVSTCYGRRHKFEFRSCHILKFRVSLFRVFPSHLEAHIGRFYLYFRWFVLFFSFFCIFFFCCVLIFFVCSVISIRNDQRTKLCPQDPHPPTSLTTI